jgi:hypothetical protein
MSLYSEIWACPQVETPHERIVLLAIAFHCNHLTPREAYPSVRRLACLCRMSKQGVQNSIASLEAKGVLRVIHGTGRRQPNHYIIADDLGNVLPGRTISSVTKCPTKGQKNVLPGRTELLKKNPYSPPENGLTEKERAYVASLTRTGAICNPLFSDELLGKHTNGGDGK